MQYAEVSEIAISLNGSPVTSFRYAGGNKVEVGSLAAIVTTYAEHRKASDLLNTWTDYIRGRYLIVEGPPVPHVIRHARDATTLGLRFLLRGQEVYQGVYTFANQQLALDPRLAVTMPWREWVRWRQAVSLFLDETRLPSGA